MRGPGPSGANEECEKTLSNTPANALECSGSRPKRAVSPRSSVSAAVFPVPPSFNHRIRPQTQYGSTPPPAWASPQLIATRSKL